ncbi:serine/threonine protein kinase [Streptomyces armeniacus]|uniref:non-specific serine/threonine protein kinase n=1 Tax=Streptomyces armeniacus TaxID=83291 RepID=A0A345XX73_9ACTN|nr:serine/threonine-protein kinase [Streptomyces armeniacus]AXK36239.1 serine/threonine protein kinase [Streptomyces armeniacus]
MTNDGGPVNEPTSYGLQPPTAAAQQQHARPQQQNASPYEPTQVATSANAPGGGGSPEGGRVLGGRYRLDARFGHGGMGTVWRAHDQVVDRDVAVKEPRVPDHLSDQERQTMYQRMRREARAAARIDHPSVVTVHDVVVEDGQPWIVMELVKGRSLGDQLTEGTLGARDAARIGLAVLGALGAAHEAGVLHRDVKPDNVLLGRYDRVVLTDFGIAQVEGEQGLTETGAFVGSPEFISPERVLGQRPGPESDLWSLGVVLYAAMEGVSPFRRSNTPATLQAVLSSEPQMPARATGALGTMIMQLLRKDPAARPDPAEIRQTLEEAARPPQPKAGTLTNGAGGTTRVQGLTRSYARALRGSRKAQFGTGGSVLAIAVALVLLLANPFADSGLPDGWKQRDETKQTGASLAVPADYVRSENEGQVTFTSKDGDWYIELSKAEDAEKGSVGEANSRLEWYKDTLYSNFENVEGTVESTKHQGKDAAELEATYQPEDSPKKRSARELVYVNGNAIEWHLILQAPDGDAASRKEAKEMFEDLVANLEIKQAKS